MRTEDDTDKQTPKPRAQSKAMLAVFASDARRKQAVYAEHRRAWYAALEAVASMKREDGQPGPQP